MNKSGRAVAGAGAVLMALGLASGPAAAGDLADTVFVAANAGWVATGVFATGGQGFDIRADGQAITLLPPRGRSLSGPNGQSGTCASTIEYTCAAEGEPWGVLIGRFGAGAPFEIGSWTGNVGAGESGELQLAVNDYIGYWTDNSGGYAVRVRPSA